GRRSAIGSHAAALRGANGTLETAQVAQPVMKPAQTYGTPSAEHGLIDPGIPAVGVLRPSFRIGILEGTAEARRQAGRHEPGGQRSPKLGTGPSDEPRCRDTIGRGMAESIVVIGAEPGGK